MYCHLKKTAYSSSNDPYMISDLELFIIRAQINYPLQKCNNSRYSGPAEQQIQYARSYPSQIEFVYSESSQKNGQYSGHNLAPYRPGGRNSGYMSLRILLYPGLRGSKRRRLCICLRILFP